jgi:Flp pilus assembly protein TadG
VHVTRLSWLARRRSEPRDAGAIAIMVAFFSVVLLAVAALVVDIGNAASVRAQSQNAADDAALAGVRALATGKDVAGAVKDYVKANLGDVDWTGCSDPDRLATTDPGDPSNECISYAVTASGGQMSYRVRVKLPPRNVQTTVAGIFGVGSITVSPVAGAVSGLQVPPPCRPCDPSLNPAGDPVASPSLSPLPSYSPSPTYSPTPSAPASSPPPSSASPSPSPSPSPSAGAGCLPPGQYDEDVTLAGPGCLDPGLFVFTKTLSAASTLSGSNVTLVFSGDATMRVDGALTLTATPAGEIAKAAEIPGIAVLFTPDDTQTFRLGPSFHISGSVYALDATWQAQPGDCQAPGDCALTDGTLSVAATDFLGSTIPLVDNGQPTPSPAPPHLDE